MRVAGGQLRGRKLLCPVGNRTRPITGRLKESLFSSLGNLDGTEVLDLFSGVGSLGIESISRGAKHATFVEKDSAVLGCLRENTCSMGIEDAVRIFPSDVYDFLDRLGRERVTFDLLFADPPYSRGDIERLTMRLEALLGLASVVVIKHSVRDEPGEYGRTPEAMKVLRRGNDRITMWRGVE